MNLFYVNVAYASVDSLISNVNRLIINPFIIFLFALAMVYFLWGVFDFFSNQDNEQKKTEGKEHMIWGLVGLAIMISVWAILALVTDTLNISNQVNPKEGTVNLTPYNPPAGH